MQRNARLAAAGLAGLIAAGSLAATLAATVPAAAADHAYAARDRGHVAYHGDWHRGWAPAYPAPTYVYPAPAPVYYPPYPYYPPASGYVHVGGPGWGVGFGF